MPSNYNGSSTGVTAHEQVTIPCPVGSDPANAASVNDPLQALADILQYIQENAALKGAIETARFDGAAGDENAAIQSAGAITTRKLVWSMTTPTKKVRFYQKSTGELEISFNAKWRTATSDWFADSFVVVGRPEDVCKVVVSGTGVKIYRPATTVAENGWADTAWELTHNLADDGGLKWIGTTTGAGGSNPARTEAVTNELRAKTAPKAWGLVRVDNGALTLSDGVNFKAASLISANAMIKIELAVPMADANFAVLLTDDSSVSGSSNTTGVAPRVSAKSKDGGSGGVAYFSVEYPGISDLSVNPGAFAFNFLVMGRQDS